MERDMDLIRDLLLHIASDPIYDGQHGITPDIASEMGITDRPIEKLITISIFLSRLAC